MHVYGDKSQDTHQQMLVAQADKLCLRSYTAFWLWVLLSLNSRQFFCQFQSTAELPEGLILNLDVFTIKCIITALLFLN